MIIDFDSIKRLTPDDILSKVPQERIYEYYLGESISGKRLSRCCFHKDRSPSLGFYKTKSDNIRYKCFGCGAEGNVFEFVMRLKNLSFSDALEDIGSVFGINNGSKSIIIPDKVNNINKEFEDVRRTIIQPVFRSFELRDYEYWNQFHISLEQLILYEVRACSSVYYYDKLGQHKQFCTDQKNNPIYCYKLDDSYKIYRPLNPTKRGKWFTNSRSFDIQGLKQLSKKRKLLFITSSLKDVMVLRNLGYEAIAPSGEVVRIPNKIIDYLWATSDNIILFNDRDKAGIESSIKLSKEYGFDNENLDFILIPAYYQTKDISDFVKAYGIEEGKKLMNRLVNGE